MKPKILRQLRKYQSRMVPYMPGRRVADKERAFVAIVSTMLGRLQSLASSQIERHARECSRTHEDFSCGVSDP